MNPPSRKNELSLAERKQLLILQGVLHRSEIARHAHALQEAARPMHLVQGLMKGAAKGAAPGLLWAALRRASGSGTQNLWWERLLPAPAAAALPVLRTVLVWSRRHRWTWAVGLGLASAAAAYVLVRSRTSSGKNAGEQGDESGTRDVDQSSAPASDESAASF